MPAIYSVGWRYRISPRRSTTTPIPSFPTTFEVPLYIRLALGLAAADGVPVPPHLALAWVRLEADQLLTNFRHQVRRAVRQALSATLHGDFQARNCSSTQQDQTEAGVPTCICEV